MLILLALNYRGIRSGARTQNMLSLLKIAMIVGLAVAPCCSRRMPLRARAAVGGRRAASARCRARRRADPVLLRLRRLPADHEPGRRPARTRDVVSRSPIAAGMLTVVGALPAAQPRVLRGARNRRHRAVQAGGGRAVARNLRSRRRSAHLRRCVSVGRRFRERDDPADAAQLPRDGAGWRAAGARSCGSTPHPGAARWGCCSSAPRCCCRRSFWARSRSSSTT